MTFVYFITVFKKNKLVHSVQPTYFFNIRTLSSIHSAEDNDLKASDKNVTEKQRERLKYSHGLLYILIFAPPLFRKYLLILLKPSTT